MILGDIYTDCGNCSCFHFRGRLQNVSREGRHWSYITLDKKNLTSLNCRYSLDSMDKKILQPARPLGLLLALHLHCPSLCTLMICLVSLSSRAGKGQHIWHEPRPRPRSLTLSWGYVYSSMTSHSISTMPVKSSAKILGVFHICPWGCCSTAAWLTLAASITYWYLSGQNGAFSLMTVHPCWVTFCSNWWHDGKFPPGFLNET